MHSGFRSREISSGAKPQSPPPPQPQLSPLLPSLTVHASDQVDHPEILDPEVWYRLGRSPSSSYFFSLGGDEGTV